MAKTHTRYVCQQCGRVAASYMGKCPQCSAFYSMVEEVSMKNLSTRDRQMSEV